MMELCWKRSKVQPNKFNMITMLIGSREPLRTGSPSKNDGVQLQHRRAETDGGSIYDEPRNTRQATGLCQAANTTTVMEELS